MVWGVYHRPVRVIGGVCLDPRMTGMIPQLIPTHFANLSTDVSVVFLLAIGKMIADNW